MRCGLLLLAALAACGNAEEANGTPIAEGLPKRVEQPTQTTDPTTPAAPPPAQRAPPLPIACVTDTDSITQSYRIALSRDPDPDGLAAYLNAIQAGTTRLGVLESICQSDELLARRAPLTDVDFLIGLYRDFFNRAPDDAGLAFWLDQIANGVTRAQVAVAFADSDEFKDPASNRATACYF